MLSLIRAGRPFAVVDLGTAYAKALIVALGPAGLWNVVGAASVCYTHLGEGDLWPERQRAGLEALQLACQRAPSLTGRLFEPAAYIVAITNDAVRLTAHHWRGTRQQPDVPIGRDEAEQLLSRARGASLRRPTALRNGSDTVVHLARLGLSLAVDGRPVTEFTGFRGSEVDVLSAQAKAPAERLAPYKEWAAAFGRPFALLPECVAALELMRPLPSLVLVDVGAACTSIYAKAPGRGFQVLRLASGGLSFTRRLSRAAGLSPSRAEQIKLAYAGGGLSDRNRRRVGLIFARGFTSWVTRLASAMVPLRPPIPHVWATVGGASQLPEFARLPASLANASIAYAESDQAIPGPALALFERSPSLVPLRLTDVCSHLIPGPEAVEPGQVLAAGLAEYVLRLARDERSRRAEWQDQVLAAKAGFEVMSDWLK